ncbi:hypothetical protein [uncultured Lactobacillus sp.]|nr:hypothetical protein [uncultured Lactobacillus sp.]
MPGVHIGKGAVIKHAIIGENAEIGDNAVIEPEKDEVVLVGNHERIGVLANEE